MRIVFLSTFYPFRGGIAQFNALLFRVMERKHEVHAFTFSRQYPDFLFPGKTQYVTSEDKADPIPSRAILDSINPFSYIKTASQIRKLKPDLVISKYWMTFFGPSLGFVLGRQSRFTKRIAILDNVIPHEKRFFDNWFNKYYINRNDGFIAMTEKVKNDLLYFRPDAKCVVIPHPIYNHFGKKMEKNEALNSLKISLKPNDKLILFFGIIRDYKGLDLLIKAMVNLSEDFKLIIAGEAYGDFNKYQKMISDLKLSDRCFVFEKYISDEEVPAFFSAADVCVLPYKSATQSGITGIAQHFELPLIATDVGGLSETILHNKTGLIVSTPDPIEIANEIKHYFTSNCKESFQNEMKEENKKNSWEAFADNLESFIKEI